MERKPSRPLVLHGSLVCLLLLAASWGLAAQKPPADSPELRRHLDAPLLFVKRFNQVGIHIYDTFFRWRPGGG
ncbi:MAG: hypothetical protein ISS72_11400, partial [Candidatus Brocadiae bacterium]|nr:hypothetical protein [Candidatus Brocadiia bacterium]